MKKYFNIPIEFEKETVLETIRRTAENNKKAYVCVIDGNVLTTSYNNIKYREILNNSLINICDGSSIALLSSFLYKEKLRAFTGPELFDLLIKEDRKHLLIGNTEAVQSNLKLKFISQGLNPGNYSFLQLPFEKVEDFDYLTIAKHINTISPELIWVSLGAPKQENFIYLLNPHLEKGISIAIGAAFNFYINHKEFKRAPEYLRKLHLEWVYRFYKEPTKNGRRVFNYLFKLPYIIWSEYARIQNEKKQ